MYVCILLLLIPIIRLKSFKSIVLLFASWKRKKRFKVINTFISGAFFLSSFSRAPTNFP